MPTRLYVQRGAAYTNACTVFEHPGPLNGALHTTLRSDTAAEKTQGAGHICRVWLVGVTSCRTILTSSTPTHQTDSSHNSLPIYPISPRISAGFSGCDLPLIPVSPQGACSPIGMHTHAPRDTEQMKHENALGCRALGSAVVRRDPKGCVR